MAIQKATWAFGEKIKINKYFLKIKKKIFQVRLVYKDSEENIPNFDDIFKDDEEDEEVS